MIQIAWRNQLRKWIDVLGFIALVVIASNV